MQPGDPTQPLRYGTVTDPRNPTGDPLFDLALNAGRNYFWNNRMGQPGVAPLAPPPVPPGMTPFDVQYMHHFGSEAMEYNRQRFMQTMNPVAPQLQRLLSQNEVTKPMAQAIGKYAGTPMGMQLTQAAMATPLMQAAMGGDLLGGVNQFTANAMNFHRMPGAYASTEDMAAHHGMAMDQATNFAQTITRRMYGQDAEGNLGIVPNQKFLRNFRTEEVFGLASRMAEAGTMTNLTAPSLETIMEDEGLSGEEGVLRAGEIRDEVQTDRLGGMVKAFSHGRNVFGNRSLGELHKMANKMLGTEATSVDPERLSKMFDKVAAMAAQTGTHVETILKGHQMMTEVITQFQGMETEVDSTGNVVSVGGRAEAMGMANMKTVAGMIAMRRRAGQSMSQGDIQNVMNRSAALTARREASSMGRATRLMATAAKAGEISDEEFQRYKIAAMKDPQQAKQIYMETFGSRTDDPMELLNNPAALEEYDKAIRARSQFTTDEEQALQDEIQAINVQADVNEYGRRSTNQLMRQTNRQMTRLAEVTGTRRENLVSKDEEKEIARRSMEEAIKSKGLNPEVEARLLSNVQYMAESGDVSARQMVTRMDKMLGIKDFGISGSEIKQAVARGTTKELQARFLDRDLEEGAGGVNELISAVRDQGGLGMDKDTLKEARRMVKEGDAKGARELLDTAAKGLSDVEQDTYDILAVASDDKAKARRDDLLNTMGIGSKAQSLIGAMQKSGEMQAVREELAEELGYTPSYAQVAEKMGISSNQVREINKLAGDFNLDEDLQKDLAGSMDVFLDDDSSRQERIDAMDTVKQTIKNSDMTIGEKNTFARRLEATGMMLDPEFLVQMGGVTGIDTVLRQGETLTDQRALGETTALTAIKSADKLGLDENQVAGFKQAAELYTSMYPEERAQARKQMQTLISDLDDDQRAALQDKVAEQGEKFQGVVEFLQEDPGGVAESMGLAADASASKQTPLQAAVKVLSGEGSVKDVAETFGLDVKAVEAAVQTLKDEQAVAEIMGPIRIDTGGQPLPVRIVEEGASGGGGAGGGEEPGFFGGIWKSIWDDRPGFLGGGDDTVSATETTATPGMGATVDVAASAAGTESVASLNETTTDISATRKATTATDAISVGRDDSVKVLANRDEDAKLSRGPGAGGGGSSEGPDEVTIAAAQTPIPVHVMNGNPLDMSGIGATS